MTQRNRKLAGLFIMLGLLIIYPVIATIIYEKTLSNAPTWLMLSYFAVAGFAWAIPAGILIKWMARPD
ncbi:MAG: DUF2842 domain-containing protein [Devosiaceae bacterium]|nr:DUF2842 domain-containing protein [Devosiaceae bacterium]